MPCSFQQFMPLELVPSAELFGMLAQVPAPQAWKDWLGSAGWLGIDGIGLILTIGFALLGAWRGLWWQVIRLVGLVAAAGLASGLAPMLASNLSASAEQLDPRLVRGIVWLILFFAGLGAFALLGKLGHKLLSAMQLALVDRFGGALAGALTGLMLHAAAVATISNLGSRSYAQEALFGTRSAALFDALSEKVPLLLDTREAELLFTQPDEPFDSGTAAGSLVR